MWNHLRDETKRRILNSCFLLLLLLRCCWWKSLKRKRNEERRGIKIEQIVLITVNDKIMQMRDQISRNESIKGSDHTSKWNFLFDSVFLFSLSSSYSLRSMKSNREWEEWACGERKLQHTKTYFIFAWWTNRATPNTYTERENIWKFIV